MPRESVESRPRTQPEPRWSLARRIGFRFLFSYFFVFLFPYPIEHVPGLLRVAQIINSPPAALTDWFSVHVLGMASAPSHVGYGSGDTTADYVGVLVVLVLAIIGTVIWSLLDRRRPHYRTLSGWLHLWLRYYLISTMFGYGMIKLIKTQFPMPGPERLNETYGESSPMGLLWTFMGASTPYTMFAGALEVLGGVLLVFRRTTTLGALVTAAVMSNVVMLNFCYDVPVKLYSSHYLLMALVIAAPDAGRLFRALVLQRSVEAASPRGPVFQRRWARIAVVVLKVVFVGKLAYTAVDSTWDRYTHGSGDAAPPPPNFGSYEVDTFVEDGVERPPLLTDGRRWHSVMVTKRGGMMIRTMNGGWSYYRVTFDTTRHNVTLSGGPLGQTATLDVVDLDDGLLELSGPLGDDFVTIRLRRADASKRLLLDRGFHWINEYPYNR